ncbi:hypothetical protein FACS1894188_04310 [Clostridia bacterium]|nr:hypothetical protein FACS1894188_04310 [Clostridia bacterium]
MSREKREKKNNLVTRVLIVFVLFVLLVPALYLVARKYLPNFTVSDSPRKTDFMLVNQTLISDYAPVQVGGKVYLPARFFSDSYNRSDAEDYPVILEEPDYGLVTVTTNRTIEKLTADRGNVFEKDGSMYISEETAEEYYPVSIKYVPEYNIAIVDSTETPITECTVTKKTPLRDSDTIKGDIYEYLPKDTKVTLYSYDGGAFSFVRADEGLTGYVLTKDIITTQVVQPSYIPQEPIHLGIDKKVVLLWEQVTNLTASSQAAKTAPPAPVNVLSPTWFSFAPSLDGSILSIADLDYVNNAHANGVLVWGLLTDNFKDEVSQTIFTNPDLRGAAIQNVAELSERYNLDGINIDFENIGVDVADHYLEFLRELAPVLHERGKTLSVDVYVPTYTKYYNRNAIGRTADYVCVMTYDEHYGAASGSGAVASLPFVDDGIAETLKEIPKERVVMGLPFYVRVWRETEDEVSVFGNYTMDGGRKFFEDKGAVFGWVEDIGSYYAEYSTVEDGVSVTYKTWLEDPTSIEEKLRIYDKYDLAGVACWKRGLENDSVWDSIKRVGGNE